MTSLLDAVNHVSERMEGPFADPWDLPGDDRGIEIAVLDRSGVIVDVNHAWKGFRTGDGGSPAPVGIGSSYLGICASGRADPQADQVDAAIRSALAGALTSPTTVTISCHSPERLRWYETAITSLRDRLGDCSGAIIALRLVTSTRRLGPSSKELVPTSKANSSDRGDPDGVAWTTAVDATGTADHFESLGDGVSRALLELVTDGILIVDDMGLVREANSRAETMFGYEHREIIGRSLRSVLPLGVPPDPLERDGTPARAGTDLSAPQLHVSQGVCRDGLEIPLVVRNRPVPLSWGTGTLVVLVSVHDRLPSGDDTTPAHGPAPSYEPSPK